MTGMKELQFTRHAVARMAERKISTADVRSIISEGNIIKEYPEDTPYPSKLLLGFSNDKPIHVVLSELDEKYIIISAYQPDVNIWESDFKRRKS
jgi:hypothetical protein